MDKLYWMVDPSGPLVNIHVPRTYLPKAVYTVFPHIVSSLEYFPPLNSFPTLVRKLFKFSLHKWKTNAETIWIFQGFTISKKNSCRGNYMRKYGIWNFHCMTFVHPCDRRMTIILLTMSRKLIFFCGFDEMKVCFD